MPIERYRNADEMPSLARVKELEERLERLDELWEAAQLLRNGSRVPRGVQRFESVSQASRARDQMGARWARERRAKRDNG